MYSTIEYSVTSTTAAHSWLYFDDVIDGLDEVARGRWPVTRHSASTAPTSASGAATRNDANSAGSALGSCTLRSIVVPAGAVGLEQVDRRLRRRTQRERHVHERREERHDAGDRP